MKKKCALEGKRILILKLCICLVFTNMYAVDTKASLGTTLGVIYPYMYTPIKIAITGGSTEYALDCLLHWQWRV